MRSRGVRYACVALATALLLCQPSFGGVEGDIELLRQVAEGHRANRESIRTWRGTATMTSASRYRGMGGPAGIEVYKSRDEVAFVYDAGAEATRWNCQRVSGTATRDGKELEEESTRRWFDNGMLKDGASFELSPMMWGAQGNLIRRSLTIEERRGSYLDPMYYLSERGQDIHERMMYYMERSESEKVSGTVSRSGDIVTFDVQQEGSLTRWQFDISQGCNLVTRLTAGPSVTENWTREYEKVAGVFLPKRVIEGYTAKGGDEFERSIQREVTFTNQAVNEPVNPSEFELAALGVQPGDWVRDNRTNTGYAYGIEGSAELAGVVVDLDGAPVGECQVSVERADDRLQLRETVCGSDGAFHFEGLPEGNLTLQAFIRPTEPGVIRDIVRRPVRAGSKDVRLVLPMQQKANTVKPVAVGEQAPELVLEGSPGGPAFSLATFKGKPVVVAFVSVYSRPCAKVLDDLKALQEASGADKLGVIAVHDRTAAPEEIEQFRKDHSIPFPIARVSDTLRDDRDSGTFRTYGATGVPWLCLLSPSGTVLGAGLSMEEVKAKIEKPE